MDNVWQLMAILVLVLFWVLLGVGVFLVAMGVGSHRRGLRTLQSRHARQLGLAGFAIATLVLGAVIPGLVVQAIEDRNSIPQDHVYNMTKQELLGRELFSLRCRNCHTLKASNAVAQVGPNLDVLRPPYSLVLFTVQNGAARGNGNMAANLVQGSDAKAVAAYVAKAVGQPVP
jgi:mono/diheme cytochrome c family protein